MPIDSDSYLNDYSNSKPQEPNYSQDNTIYTPHIIEKTSIFREIPLLLESPKN